MSASRTWSDRQYSARLISLCGCIKDRPEQGKKRRLRAGQRLQAARHALTEFCKLMNLGKRLRASEALLELLRVYEAEFIELTAETRYPGGAKVEYTELLNEVSAFVEGAPILPEVTSD